MGKFLSWSFCSIFVHFKSCKKTKQNKRHQRALTTGKILFTLQALLPLWCLRSARVVFSILYHKTFASADFARAIFIPSWLAASRPVIGYLHFFIVGCLTKSPAILLHKNVVYIACLCTHLFYAISDHLAAIYFVISINMLTKPFEMRVSKPPRLKLPRWTIFFALI